MLWLGYIPKEKLNLIRRASSRMQVIDDDALSMTLNKQDLKKLYTVIWHE